MMRTPPSVWRTLPEGGDRRDRSERPPKGRPMRDAGPLHPALESPAVTGLRTCSGCGRSPLRTLLSRAALRMRPRICKTPASPAKQYPGAGRRTRKSVRWITSWEVHGADNCAPAPPSVTPQWSAPAVVRRTRSPALRARLLSSQATWTRRLIFGHLPSGFWASTTQSASLLRSA